MRKISLIRFNKKISAVILSAILTTSMIFTGCGNDNNVVDNQVVSEDTVKNISNNNSTDEEINEKSKETEESNDVLLEETENIEENSEDNITENKISEENSSVKENNNVEEKTTNEQISESGSTVTASSVAKAEAGTPVANHGKLSVKGTKLVDKNGKPYQIQGVSTHGLGWFPEYVNKDAFKTMRDEWGINCIRLAMYSAEGAGYCTGGNQAELKKTVNNGVSYATELGLYVIIDWHVLQDRDPNTYKKEAIAFFDEMSKKYASYDNVLYEICNEPNSGVDWPTIKKYALEVIPVIKANDPNAIIIVGTPTWSQDVDIAANDPITGFTNIMYTIHFYAETHRDSLRNKMKTALNKGLPVMCTEFGICDASGNGTINEAEANKWISEMQANGVGYCIWNLSNKNESSSLIASGCNKKSGWTENDLSQEGKWYVGILGGKALGVTASETDSNNNNSNDNNSSNNTSSSVVKASSSNTEVTVVNSGNWNDGKNNCYQYTVTIKNIGSSPVKDWKINVNFSSSIGLDQSWSGTYSVNGSSVVISPCDYNKEIAAGTSCEVGFIVTTSGSLASPSVSIN